MPQDSVSFHVGQVGNLPPIENQRFPGSFTGQADYQSAAGVCTSLSRSCLKSVGQEWGRRSFFVVCRQSGAGPACSEKAIEVSRGWQTTKNDGLPHFNGLHQHRPISNRPQINNLPHIYKPLLLAPIRAQKLPWETCL